MTFLLDIIQPDGEKLTTFSRYHASFVGAIAWAESVANAWAMQFPNMSVILYLH